jgi:hypothetical protein
VDYRKTGLLGRCSRLIVKPGEQTQPLLIHVNYAVPMWAHVPLVILGLITLARKFLTKTTGEVAKPREYERGRYHGHLLAGRPPAVR